MREVRETWRVALEAAETRELRGFANREEAFAFLQQEVTATERGRDEAPSDNAALSPDEGISNHDGESPPE